MVTHGSRMRFFLEFCYQTGVEPGKFLSNLHLPQKLQEEYGVLNAFKKHASRAPSMPGKHKFAGT